ncbi:MAG TPA: BON domain-containing protein [Vicinamibacterales bacterium]|nr:BON domain-containing protein [Vicinamibacterales bacterium]
MNARDVLVGVGIGAVLTYVADPAAGRRRRALARDQLVRASRKTRDALDATARDMANRTTGIVAATRGRWRDRQVDDRRLLERVRAKLGRACSHPRALDVMVADGMVTLRGPILAAEVSQVLATVGAVRGVRHVENELELHESADGVPSLQGEGTVAGPSIDLLQRNWAPATQALVTAGLAATGLCIAMYARRASKPDSLPAASMIS